MTLIRILFTLPVDIYIDSKTESIYFCLQCHEIQVQSPYVTVLCGTSVKKGIILMMYYTRY